MSGENSFRSVYQNGECMICCEDPKQLLAAHLHCIVCITKHLKFSLIEVVCVVVTSAVMEVALKFALS